MASLDSHRFRIEKPNLNAGPVRHALQFIRPILIVSTYFPTRFKGSRCSIQVPKGAPSIRSICNSRQQQSGKAVNANVWKPLLLITLDKEEI
jgi:hypothetical protein